jgi:hypothetical protein
VNGGRCTYPLGDVRRAFGDITVDSWRWDFIVAASELIEHDLPGLSPILDAQAYTAVREAWQRCTA